MARVKRGVMKNKRRSKILKLAKGYRNARSTKFKQAKQAVIRAGQHAFAHRRKKKRVFRKLWQVQIGAGLQEHKISYSRFIDKLNKGEFGIDRKMLALLAREDIASFDRVVSAVTGTEIKREAAPEMPEEVKEVVEKKEEKVEAPKKEAAKDSSDKDDLKKIEGVGPKIEEALNAGGIMTFADLAASTDEATQELIKDVRGNHQAGTWNEQAELARDGKWDELKTLQDALDGGVEK